MIHLIEGDERFQLQKVDWANGVYHDIKPMRSRVLDVAPLAAYGGVFEHDNWKSSGVSRKRVC